MGPIEGHVTRLVAPLVVGQTPVSVDLARAAVFAAPTQPSGFAIKE